jgi:hypothetical protein
VTAVAPGLFYRHLTIDEVLARQRARHDREISAHNASVVERLELEPATSKRDQVLAEFDPRTRRICRSVR